MNLIALYCVFSKSPHPKEIPTMQELFNVPIIHPKEGYHKDFIAPEILEPKKKKKCKSWMEEEKKDGKD